MKLRCRPASTACFIPAFALALGGVASAADRYWDGTNTTANADGGAGTWNTTVTNLNWDDAATAGANAFFANNDNVFFGGSAGIVTFGSNVTAGTMNFSTAGYTVRGISGGNGAYTFSGLTTLPTTGTTTFNQNGNNNRFLFSGGINLNGSAISINLRNTLNGASPSTATGKITGNGTVTVTNELSGTNNTARLVLSGNNDYTGGTTLDKAILDTNSATALGTSTLTINASDAAITTVIRNTSAGALTWTNNNAMNWNGDFTFSANTTRSGTSSGTTRDLNMGIGVVTLGGNRIVTTTANTLTVGGVIDDGASTFNLTKAGAGTLVLSGSNTYGGTTTVSGGTLVVNGNISTSSLTTVAIGATLGGSGTVGKATINGTLAVGNSPGTMTFTDTLDLNGSTVMEIDGTSGAGVTGGHDFINLTGSGAAGVLTYGGTLTIDLGVILGTGSYSWNLFDMTSETGTFSTITLADQYSGSLLDADLDGVCDLTSGSNTWQFTESTGVLGLTVVPEPAATLLGGLGLLSLLRRRR